MKSFTSLVLVLFFLTISNIFAVQDDTVKVVNISNIPIINAIPDDDCWKYLKWQSIDQVWINYGETILSEDFTGNYKICWSSITNLLYFLVEVTDDAFVDGWGTENGDYYNFDIVEVFIDQDKSGGYHIFDNAGGTLGDNAENAFTYHINIDLAENEGEASTTYVVNDHDGTGWGASIDMNYASHFPELALRKYNGKYYWEFSLIVYNDTYDNNNPKASRVILQEGDIMGLSLAYCDNDDLDEDPNERDNFYGSVWVPEEAYNDHWMNADGYGTILLTGDITEVNDDIFTISEYKLYNNYPNPFNPSTTIKYQLSKPEFVSIKIYDILGNEIITLVNEPKAVGSFSILWNGKNNNGNIMSTGIYFVKMTAGAFTYTRKMTLIK